MPKKTVELQGLDWLYARLEKLGYQSLSEFATDVGINKGNLYRYFSFESKPSITVLPALSAGLKVKVEELLRALGVVL
jgi:transcriptional regulator with XRE-family HTH domain